MVLSGFPLAVGLSLLSPEITAVLLPTYTPNELNKVAKALQWLSWAGGLIFITTAVLAVLRATDKRRAFSVLMGTTAFLNICLNLYLIPRFSHVGAAIAMVMSEAFLLTFGIGYISRNIVKFRETPLIFPTILKAGILSGVMGIGLTVLKGFLPIWVLIPLAVLFYGGGITILGEFRARLRFD
jgi:O-antigen/teichoic acid export membrane protein